MLSRSPSSPGCVIVILTALGIEAKGAVIRIARIRAR
jgi:hypothetical protein